MRRNLSHIAAMAFNEPLLLEPAYARVFFCALGKEMGAGSLAVPQQAVQLDADGMQLAVTDYMAGGQRPAKSYQVKNGIAILPVSGTLVHKLGTLRPYSGMTGYDGLTARLQMAVNDPDVRGILLDIDSPGGQAAGAFDCADMIYRLREQKPVWALCNDMACSAAMLLAAACTRRLVTQTAKIGSIGVMMAHTSYEKHLDYAIIIFRYRFFLCFFLFNKLRFLHCVHCSFFFAFLSPVFWQKEPAHGLEKFVLECLYVGEASYCIRGKKRQATRERLRSV